MLLCEPDSPISYRLSSLCISSLLLFSLWPQCAIHVTPGIRSQTCPPRGRASRFPAVSRVMMHSHATTPFAGSLYLSLFLRPHSSLLQLPNACKNPRGGWLPRTCKYIEAFYMHIYVHPWCILRRADDYIAIRRAGFKPEC